MLYFKAFLVFFMVTLYSLMAHAVNPYTIEDINVKDSGTNATEARNNAILAAERKAFYLLLKRITPEFVHHAFPQLEDEEISKLVISHEIENEKVTSNTYQANLSIAFNPDYIKKLIGDSGIVAVEKKQKPVVVIPYFGKNSLTLSQSKNNIWSKAWEEAAKSSYFVDFKITDENAKLSDILNNKQQINQILTKYNSDKIILARATIIEESTKPIFVKLYFLSNQDTDETSKGFKLDKSKQIPAQLQDIAKSIMAKINNKWKMSQGGRQNTKLKINVSVPLENLDQWNLINNKLKSADFIDKVYIKQISVLEANLDLHFQTNYKLFLDKLSNLGLFIQNEEDGLYLKDYSDNPFKDEAFINQNTERYDYGPKFDDS